MKYSLDLHIITNKQDVIDALLTKIPAKLDARVWADEYEAAEGLNTEGNRYVNAKVRFNEDAERTTVWNWMKNKKDEANEFILTGSFIRLHTCYHDSNPPGKCIETNLWRK